MTGIYFSGTGNSRHCVEVFLNAYGGEARAFSIEDPESVNQIRKYNDIVIGYPVQYSNTPKILKDYITAHKKLWKGKRIFIIATMGLFSGDGAGVLGRQLKKYGAVIAGGLHLKMPDSISDEKALKRPLEQNRKLVKDAEGKIRQAAEDVKKGRFPREGMGPFFHLAGLLGQRLYFYHKTDHYTDKLKIDGSRCIGCGRCADLCPLHNITVETGRGTALSGPRCTMCYRCVNHCPVQAITLLGRKVVDQGTLEKYL